MSAHNQTSSLIKSSVQSFPTTPAVNKVYRKRILTYKIGMILSFMGMVCGLIVLMWILATLVINGLGAMNLELLTQNTSSPDIGGGGLLNPIIGSLMLVGLATLISTPIGILA